MTYLDINYVFRVIFAVDNFTRLPTWCLQTPHHIKIYNIVNIYNFNKKSNAEVILTISQDTTSQTLRLRIIQDYFFRNCVSRLIPYF